MPATPKPPFPASGAFIAPLLPRLPRTVVTVLAGAALAFGAVGAQEVNVAPPGIFDLAGTTIELDALVSGAAPGTFQVQWALNGNPVNPNGTTYTISPLGPSTSGPYTASVTAPSGSATSAPVSVSIGAGYTVSTLAGVGGGSADGVHGAARFQAATAVGGEITSPSSLTVTCTVSPSLIRPPSSRSESGFCSVRWIVRFSGRAP